MTCTHTNDMYTHTNDMYTHTNDMYTHTNDMYTHTNDMYTHTNDMYTHTKDTYVCLLTSKLPHQSWYKIEVQPIPYVNRKDEKNNSKETQDWVAMK